MSILSKFLRKKRKTPKYRINYHPYKNSVALRKKSARKPFIKKLSFLKRINKTFALGVLLAAIFLITYSLLFSNYFKIKSIEFENQDFEMEKLSQEIQKNISSSIGKNIFWTNTDELKTQILSSTPELEKVDINKKYPDKLVVSVNKYPFAANVINESNSVKKSYIINSIGFAVKEDFENPNLTYIRIKSDEPINTNNAIIESSKLKYILDTIKYFEDKFGMKIKEVTYKPIPREIHLLTEKDFYIWLDIQVPAENQFKKLKKALVKLDIYKENLQYIDLRIAGESGDKIIYKRR